MSEKLLKTIKYSATALFVSAILNLSVAVLTLLGGLGRLLFQVEKMPADPAELSGFVVGTVIGYGAALLTLVASPLVIYGSVRMMKVEAYRMSVAAAILSVIPFTSCCFVLGIPFGIWALTVLYRRETRELFENRGYLRPPEPPAFGV